MNENKRIAINSIIIFIRLIVVSIISLISSRLVLQALGASDYGLYNVVGGIVVVLNLLNTAMNSTTYRYIAFELGKGEVGDTNKVFNTSFMIHSIFALAILVIGESVGEYYISNYLNILPEKLGDAKFVFRLSVLTTVLTTLSVPYSGLLVAYERFFTNAIFDIVADVFKLVGIVLLFFFVDERIRIYSLVMLSYNVFLIFLKVIYCRKNFYNTVKIKLYKELDLCKEMLAFTVWIFVGASATIGKTQGAAIVINYFFGTVVNAAFAIANHVQSFVLMFSNCLNNAAIPQITKSFSGGNQKRTISLTCYISKYTFILMSLVAFPVLLEMDFLLSIWLKVVPDGAADFCRLMVLQGLLDCLGAGIPAMIQATGKIKYFQIVMSSITLVGLPIAFWAFKMGYPPITINIIFCFLIFLSAFVRLYLLKVNVKIPIRDFIKISYSRIGLISIPLVALYLFYNPGSFTPIQHSIALIVLEFIVVIDVVLLGVDNRERALLKDQLSTLTKKRK